MKRSQYWEIRSVAMGFTIWWLLTLLISVAAPKIVTPMVAETRLTAVYVLITASVAQILWLPVALFFFTRRTAPFREFFAIRLPAKRRVLEIGGVFAALFIALSLMDHWLDFSQSADHWRQQIFASSVSAGAHDIFLRYCLNAIFIVVAPICEELLFRGFWFRVRLSPRAVIALSAALWTLCHAQYDWRALIAIFTLGIFFGYARYYGRSLPLCVGLHSLNNALALGGGA